MKILFFSRLFYPHIGGVEKHVMRVSQLLIEKGYKVTVITEQYSKDLAQKENIKGIEILRIPGLKDDKFKKFKIWKWLFLNRQLIERAHIIHCHDVFFWYLPFRFLFPTKKVFTTFHGYESYPLKLQSIFMHKISEKLSTGNICIGEFIKKWYKTNPDLISYGGVDLSLKKIKQPKNESAVFIGRLDEQTGILTYVDAIKEIREKIPNFEFLIIGDGKLRNKIGDKNKILKFQNNALEYFQKYNFAFVSRYLSIMEAMAARRLVFAVYDNSLKEDYLKMAPFSKYIIISNSSSQLVSKFFFYLSNLKEKEKIIENAYRWVKNQTWEDVLNTYLKLWKIEF